MRSPPAASTVVDQCANLSPVPSAAQYAGTPLFQKLGIASGMRVVLLHAPDGLEGAFGPLPEGVRLQHGLRRTDRVDLIVGFVTEREHLARNFEWLVGTLPPDGAFWVAWPKKSAGILTDMTADAVREIALPMGWVDVKVCAVDETWSGLKVVLRRSRRLELSRRVCDELDPRYRKNLPSAPTSDRK